MHLVTKSQLRDYRTQYPNCLPEDTLFEAFVNYCALRQFSSDSVEPNDLVFPGDDTGVDGVLICVGDAFVSTLEELEGALDGRTRDVEVRVLFTQAKTGEAWKKQEINNFTIAIQDFLSDQPRLPMSDKLEEQHKMFFRIFDFIGVVSGGRPLGYAYFATTDKASNAAEIIAAGQIVQDAMGETGYFANATAILLDREQLNSLWLAAGGAVEAKIKTIGIAAFPASPGIDASYVATVSADEFIRKILCDESGALRQRLFDENVRDYIGADNEVNAEIAATLDDPDKQKRFGVMNNGVTIVSPDVRVQGVDLFIRDFQIINGCQTSNVLFEKRADVGPDANLMMKVVHAKEPTFIEDIVRSTNRQSKVQDEQFLATVDTLKGVEKYFEAREDGEDQRLYFERRKNQYAGRGIPAIRIFDVKHLARCVGAMFIERPDLASRYPNRLTGELKDSVFNPSYKEEIYYAAAVAYYRVFLLFSNQKLDPKFSNLKWHLLMAIKIYLQGSSDAHLNSRKVVPLCKRIEDFVRSGTQDDVAVLNSLCNEISGGEQLSRDQLRNQTILSTMKVAASSLAP